MTAVRWYAAVLAALLIGFAWSGNALASDPHRVSVFPGAICLLAFPLAIYPALRHEARTRVCTGAQLRRAGWSIVWPASIMFGVFLAAFEAYRFENPPAWFLAVGFAGSAVVSMVLGYLCAVLCAVAVMRSAGPSQEAAR